MKKLADISKRAGVLEHIKETLWRNDEGPLENILRLSSYLAPLAGIGGWALLAIDKWLSEQFQWGLEDLGKKLDAYLGLGPGSDVSETTLNAIPGFFNMLVATKLKNQTIIKEAFWGGAWVVIKLLPKIIGQLVKYLLIAYGISSIRDLYDNDSLDEDDSFSASNNIFEPEETDPSLNPKNYGPQGYIQPRSS